MNRQRLKDEDVQQSLRWIFRQPEARPFLQYLQCELEEIGPSETCALHAHNARRTFASELIVSGMSKEDSGSDGTETGYDRTAKQRKAPVVRSKSRRHGPTS